MLALLLHSTVATAAACSSPQPFAIRTEKGACVSYPKLSSLPRGPFRIRDAFPMPYVVTTPCENVTRVQVGSNCTTYNAADSAGAPAYAVSEKQCYALGHGAHMAVAALDAANSSAGVVAKLSGGVGGRAVSYRFICDEGAAPDAGPTKAVEGGIAGYEVIWPTPAACPAAAVAAPCPAAAAIPKPTTATLLYQEMEIGALVCYNMATAMGSQGCAAKKVPPASTFIDNTPSKADTDQWCRAIASFGGKYATYVVKHVCGFLVWPSNASSGNFTYNYGVQDRDLIRQLAESCAGVGVKLGLYYSVNNNVYLNYPSLKDPTPGQAVVTQAQYNDIVIQHLTELWTNYGSLAEIWFDGGFNVPGLKEPLLALYSKLQSNAVVFNGCGLSKNAVIWIGTESGHSPYPLWNTQTGCASGTGTADGTTYLPKEVDLTLQNSDTWFYQEGRGYRSLNEMVSIYHDSVGHGGNMLLNIAPPPNSTLPDIAMKTYEQLGDFISSCYGSGSLPSASALAATHNGCRNCTSVALSFAGGPRMFDRVLLKEELSQGQLVLAFDVLADGKVILNGTSIGRTYIALLQKNVTASKVELRVTASRATPSFRLVAIPDPTDCAVTAGHTGCDLLPNTKFKGISIKSTTVTSVAQCCAACAALKACAFFVADTHIAHSIACSLLDAQQGSEKATGFISGSPKK